MVFVCFFLLFFFSLCVWLFFCIGVDVRRLEWPDRVRRSKIPAEFQHAPRHVGVSRVKWKSISIGHWRLDAPLHHGIGPEFRRSWKYCWCPTCTSITCSCRRPRYSWHQYPHVWNDSVDRWITERSINRFGYVEFILQRYYHLVLCCIITFHTTVDVTVKR